MKKSIQKITVAVVLMLTCTLGAMAQSFEGVIEFKKASTLDTTSYIYYVKGGMVRIDEIGARSHKVEGTFLINLDAKTMKSLNHERKLYMDQSTPSVPVMKGSCTVKKGTNVKNLQGYKCNEYVVTNAEEATVITYYIADGKFTFFEKLLNQLNRKEKSSIYFLQIKDVKNMFPMLSETADLTGKKIGSLEVTKITNKSIDASMFEIPKGYKPFEK